MGWLRRLRDTLVGSRFDDHLDEELRFHIDQRTDDFIRRGMSPDEARREALRRFGNLTATTEHARDTVTLRWLYDLGQDVRYAIRDLRKHLGFTAVAIGTLTLGIGGTTVIFAVVRAVLLKPPPYVEANRLVMLKETRPGGGSYTWAISGPQYLDWRRQNTVFEEMAAMTGGGAALRRDGDTSVYVEGERVSASYFDVFGLRAALGRTFAPDEEQPAKSHVVVISHRLWASQFGSDPTIIGRSLYLDAESYTVIGVMPLGATVDLFDADVWRPRDLGRQGGAATVDGPASRDVHDLIQAVARLKPGVSLTQARTQMNAIANRLAQAYPASNKGRGVSLQVWPRPLGQDVEPSLHLLLAAVGVVLLIGCVNIAILALVRSAARAREIAIRAALGAGRSRLVRQFLTENLVIAIGGGLCGVVAAYAGLPAIEALIPFTGVLKTVPEGTTIAIDARVGLFALMLSLISGIACGLAPAWGATRLALAGAIKEGGGTLSGSGREQRRLREALVVIQIALAFVLLSSAGLLMHSFFALQQRMLTGFDSTNVLTAGFPIPDGRFTDPEDLNPYLDQIGTHIQSIPGIQEVAFTEGLPTWGGAFVESFQIADQPPVERSQRPFCNFKTVSASYFRAVGLHVLKGRALNDHDRQGTPPAIVINETFAHTYFPGLDPTGKRLLMRVLNRLRGTRAPDDVAWTVVGVVADEGLTPWARAPEPMIYVTREQNPTQYLLLVVRASLDPTRLQESIRKAVSAVDHDQALTYVQTLAQVTTDDTASDRMRSIVLGAFAAIALTLAAIGLYGVIAHSVVQRTREIGIRAALGASAASLVALVVRQGMVMTGCGLAFGFVGAIVARRLLATLLFGVRSGDPMIMVAGGALLTVVALLACYVPAHRAASVDPSIALRLE
jgi:predicted permease